MYRFFLISVFTSILAVGCRSDTVPVQDARSAFAIEPSALADLPSRLEQPTFFGDMHVARLRSRFDIAADGPRYFLWSDAKHNYWIMAGGGYMGQTTWYGPLSSEQLDTLIQPEK